MFPPTPQTLLKKIAELAAGDDSAEWEAFVEMYTQPLWNFIHSVNAQLPPESIEDAVQDVFIRLVDVLRSGKIDRTKGTFRSYLATMTRRILIDRYRETLARPQGREDGAVTSTYAAEGDGRIASITDADPGTIFDLRWRVALREAAVHHVLTKTAISEQSKAIYCALEGLGSESPQTPRDVAARFGVSYDVVKQVKSRIDRTIQVLEAQMIQASKREEP